ncbi:MAG TPA: nitrate reductase molybdenum cofactor assembly chaperone [Allocoleopsis sp.]
MQQQIYHIFSKWLAYPTNNIQDQLTKNSILINQYPEVDQLVGEFINFLINTPLSNQEEIYTSTFDLNPTCYPYLGYQLFGDGYQRGDFLVKLKAKYHLYGFVSDSDELADHLTIVLEFLSRLSPDEKLFQELIEDGLIPGIEKMQAGFKETNPYSQLLAGLLLILKQQ